METTFSGSRPNLKNAAPSHEKQTRISDHHRMTMETSFEMFELFADPELRQDTLAPFGQDFASPCLRGSEIVACFRQQHLPRLSTMRTKGGFLFSGPRPFKSRGRGAQDEAFAPRGAQQSDCRRSLDRNLTLETGFPADWKSLLCSHP